MELGISHVDEMLESMTALQYNEWLAFFAIRKEKENQREIPNAIQKKRTQEEEQFLGAQIISRFGAYQKRQNARRRE